MNEQDDQSLQNEPLTFDEAKSKYNTLRSNRDGLTRTSGFPTTGTKVYKGIHGGEFFDGNSTSETKIEYYAQVEFILDFEAGTFSGKLANFTTSLEGYESPEGELNVSGSIRGPEDLGGDEYGLRFSVSEGEITQGDRVAIFDSFTESKGRFSGDTGESVNIRITSTFKWAEGPDESTTSGTIGFVIAEVEEN